MRLPGRKYARRALRPLRRALFPGAVVLGYHRIADAAWDPLGLAVSPARFAQQVEVLRSLRRIISLGELAARHAAGEPLQRYAVLTFDDGYQDFFRTVLPIVAEFEVPATVFVASGFIGRNFWWEEIAALLAPEVAGGKSLRLLVDGAEPMHFSDMGGAEGRSFAARSLGDHLACGEDEQVNKVLDQLREWAGGVEGKIDGMPMSAAELAALARHPLAEIGAHTVSHGCLATLEPDAQRSEIERSKTQLEALSGASVEVFSYPNGSLDAHTPRLVEAQGFSCACTSMEGMFTRRSNSFRIPRLWVPNAGGEVFKRWLGQWVAKAR